MLDVLDDIAARADNLTPEYAAPIYEALGGLASKVRDVRGLYETRLKVTLEQPQVIGSKAYAVKQDGKWRPDHQAIKSNIISTAILDVATGELRDPTDAAAMAVDLTYDLFVAERTEPKVTGLVRIGFKDKKSASQWEHTGTRLVVTELGFPEDAA
jgi:hypothetical protein